MESDSSCDSSDLLEASPEKTLSSSIWCESRIGIQRKELGNSSKESEESIADSASRSSKEINFDRQHYRDRQVSESDSDEEESVIKQRDAKSNCDQSETDEEVVVSKKRVIKSARHRSRLLSDSDSEQNLSDADAHIKWRKKPIVQSDSESDNYQSASIADSESEDADDTLNYKSPPILVKNNQMPETPCSTQRNQNASEKCHADGSGQMLKLSDSSTKSKFSGNTSKIRTSSGKSHADASSTKNEFSDNTSKIRTSSGKSHADASSTKNEFSDNTSKIRTSSGKSHADASSTKNEFSDKTSKIRTSSGKSDADASSTKNAFSDKTSKIRTSSGKSDADASSTKNAFSDKTSKIRTSSGKSHADASSTRNEFSDKTSKIRTSSGKSHADASSTRNEFSDNTSKIRTSSGKSHADASGPVLELSDSGSETELNSSISKKGTSKVSAKAQANSSGPIMELSDSDSGTEIKSNINKKRVSKEKNIIGDTQSINVDSSSECICLDDTPVGKHSLNGFKKHNIDFGQKISPTNRSEHKHMKQGAIGKDPDAMLSELVDRIKATSLSQQEPGGSQAKEKAAKHNEHELPVFVLGKKLEKVALAEKVNSDLSADQKRRELEMKINKATENIIRLKKTLKNTNLDVLPDRGERLRISLAEEEGKLQQLFEECRILLREYPPEKTEKQHNIYNPRQPVGNATAPTPAIAEGNRYVVPNPFQAAIQAASQQKMNAGNEKKPLYLGSMPTTAGMGQKALQTFKAERSMTVETLKQLHQSMETCPSEDTLAEDPKLLKSSVTLMPHQKRALAWLLWRESSKPYGGILADDMGLGKTLTMISLVLKVKELAESKAEDEKDEGSGTDDEHETSWYKSRKKWEKGGTLVICPASLINQWESEVKNRCKRGALDIEVFHGSSRESKPRRLARHDMVITTYSIVRSEGAVVTGKRGAGDSYEYSRQGPLFGVKWERIILDEAHQIRNHKSQTSIAACGLRAKYRWALTGTPMHNKDLDLYSLLKFLRCSPFDDLSIWRHWVGNKTAGGMQRLNTVMNSLMLRRTKEQLHSKGALGSLSEKHMHQITVKLDKEEFEVYDTVLSLSRSVFQMFLEQRAEKAMEQWESNKKGRQSAIQPPDNPYELNDELKALHQRMTNMQDIKTFEILVLLLRLRQICCLPGLIKSMLDEESCQNDTIEDEEGVDIDLMSKMNMLGLEDKENENSDTLNADKVVKRKVLVADNPVFDMKRMSSKMQRLFKILEEQILPTGDNVVIVSQWSTLLEIMKSHLQNLGVKCLILTGAIPVKDRMAIVDAFNAPSEKSIVLLLSLTAGGVGLNLIGGNHLLLFDIHWNPQLEAQAFDRVYRVGQTKAVHIYKFICEDTIEQRILALQTKKLQLADSILTGVRQKQASKLTLDDLKMLFNLHKT